MDIERALAEFALTARPSASARQMMRLSLLDWAACALAGQTEDVSRIVRTMVKAEGGAGQASLIGSAQKVPARAAALANGATSHALDYDDTHFAHIGHPSVAVIPAALATAESCGASGADFLDAALIGAEASIRVGIWLGRSHYQAGFHQTATAGIFGATVASGRLLGLDNGQMRQAFGIASTRAAGLKSQFGTMGKPYHAGLAAAGGIESAVLAQAGFQSDRSGLSGPLGFGATHAGAANMDGFLQMGQVWQVQNISHKFHACCHGLHAMLEALASISDDFDAVDVASVKITAHPRWENVCNQNSPGTGLGVKFSFRHTCAMSLAGIDTAALASFSDGVANDPALRALAGKVEVGFDPQIAETATRAVVRLNDGTEFTNDYDIGAPMPVDERQARLISKAESLLGKPHAEKLWAAIHPETEMANLLCELAPKVL